MKRAELPTWLHFPAAVWYGVCVGINQLFECIGVTPSPPTKKVSIPPAFYFWIKLTKYISSQFELLFLFLNIFLCGYIQSFECCEETISFTTECIHILKYFNLMLLLLYLFLTIGTQFQINNKHVSTSLEISDCCYKIFIRLSAYCSKLSRYTNLRQFVWNSFLKQNSISA